MSRHEKTLRAVLSGSADAAVDFEHLLSLLRHLGYAERVRGSHHVFTRSGVREILNLQPTEPYQVRQVREVLRRYHGDDAAHAE